MSCYPRWFSYFQARLADITGGNQMAWPDRMTPVFGYVVAPNDNTLYAAGFFDFPPNRSSCRSASAGSPMESTRRRRPSTRGSIGQDRERFRGGSNRPGQGLLGSTRERAGTEAGRHDGGWLAGCPAGN
jgi:hypothetical protein